MMPRLRQALIEFENMEDAINCVQSCQVIQPASWFAVASPLAVIRVSGLCYCIYGGGGGIQNIEGC